MKQKIAKRICALQQQLRQMRLHAAMFYDRENLIYFTGLDDLEGGALAVPAEGEPELFCLWMDAEHVRTCSGIEKVTGYRFPRNNQSTMMGAWLRRQGWTRPRLGFTRYFISLKDYQCLLDAAPDMEVCDVGAVCYRLRSVKEAEEVRLMRKAGEALASGMQAAFDCVRPGMSEVELLAEAEYAMARAGSQGSSFRMQVLTHSRQMLMHPYASQATLENDAPVVIHLGATCQGYAAKMCRTVFLGTPREESVRIYETLCQAQAAAAQILRPGVSCGEIYDAAAACVDQMGYGGNWIMEHIGYGVGIRQSEFYPIIAKGSDVILEENMVVDLLLPTIYVPGAGGPRLTDTILVTKDGPDFLTHFSQEPVFR